MGRRKHYNVGEPLPRDIVSFVACGRPRDVIVGSLLRSKQNPGYVNVVLELSQPAEDNKGTYVTVRSVRFAKVNIDGTHALLDGRRSRNFKLYLRLKGWGEHAYIPNTWERVEARKTLARTITYVRVETLKETALAFEIASHVKRLEGVNTQYVPPEPRADNDGDE